LRAGRHPAAHRRTARRHAAGDHPPALIARAYRPFAQACCGTRADEGSLAAQELTRAIPDTRWARLRLIVVGPNNEKGTDMSLTDPVLTGPGAGRTRSYGGGSAAELKIVGEQSGGEWAVVENRVRAGDEPPIHTHTREDETVYVLEGAITAYVGDQQFEVEAGSYAALPNNVPHGFTVRGEEVRLLQTLHPAGVEYFFVPRDEGDSDPAKFGLILQERAPAM
jgi:quercetin dioxygenase-like cupin family protein